MAWSKESRQSRGYGAKWDKTRARILKRDCGICQPCLKRGILHVGTEVDHIISKANAKKIGWTEEQIEADSNLQTICHDEHKRKTAEEQGKALWPKVKIGVDGFPIEV